MDKPILFSGLMVRAILDGRKSQTRRAVKPRPVEIVDGIPYRNVFEGDGIRSERRIVGTKVHRCPYGKPGDRLWVRETWRADDYAPEETIYHADASVEIALDIRGIIKFKPSIHMPRCRSRITLEVTGVRVERLQDISEADAQAEGITDSFPEHECNSDRPYADGFEWLWDSINAERCPWASNPWVWVVELKRA